jgi:hypothetical protein
MAELNFIRGSIKGKIGQLVGSSWRGKDYIKTYTAPGNPKTPEQVAIRTIFQHTAHIASAIYEDVLKPYTFPKPRKMTAYNRMIQVNSDLFDGKEWDQKKLKIFDGPLFNPGIAGAVIEDAGTPTAAVKITFDGTVGAGTDKAIAVIHDEIAEATLYAEADRSVGEIVVPLAALPHADISQLHAYLVFARTPAHGTGSAGEVSGTAYLKVPPPSP